LSLSPTLSLSPAPAEVWRHVRPVFLVVELMRHRVSVSESAWLSTGVEKL
jgi:hypothetical protein